MRPRSPRLIRQPVNTLQGEGAEGRRPDGRRGGKPEPRPSCRKWGSMWKHPVQRGLGWWPSRITPSTTKASSVQGGAAGLGARPRTWFLTSPKDMINGSLLWVVLPLSTAEAKSELSCPSWRQQKDCLREFDSQGEIFIITISEEHRFEHLIVSEASCSNQRRATNLTLHSILP